MWTFVPRTGAVAIYPMKYSRLDVLEESFVFGSGTRLNMYSASESGFVVLVSESRGIFRNEPP